MGMYDNVKIEYEMPDPEIQDSMFQTKDLENMLDNYTITKEGRLIWHKCYWEEVPEEERPYYGKPEWDDNGIFQFIGSMKTIPDGDEDLNFHGVLEVHELLGDPNAEYEWFSYNLKFTDGTLVEVIRNENRI